MICTLQISSVLSKLSVTHQHLLNPTDYLKSLTITKRKKWKKELVNVRSMKSADGHREDVRSDNFLMDSNMFSLCETWLENDEKVEFNDYSCYFANFGSSKGVASNTKIELISLLETVLTQSYSAINFKTSYFHIIFL